MKTIGPRQNPPGDPDDFFVMISEQQIQIDKLTHLFREKYVGVIGVARRYAPTSGHVEDIVQQVYLNFVLRALKKSLDLEQDIGPLLYRMTKNEALMQWRKQKSRRESSIDTVWEQLIASFEETDEYELNELRKDALVSCLEKLPPKSREIVKLHYFEGVSMREISNRQSVESSVIRHLFGRIRLKLRECILKAIQNK